LGKRSFGKQAAQEIRDFESDKKRVGVKPGPENAGDDRVAYETKNPRDQRHAADGRQRFE
jgi:hypothetical protein